MKLHIPMHILTKFYASYFRRLLYIEYSWSILGIIWHGRRPTYQQHSFGFFIVYFVTNFEGLHQKASVLIAHCIMQCQNCAHFSGRGSIAIHCMVGERREQNQGCVAHDVTRTRKYYLYVSKIVGKRKPENVVTSQLKCRIYL